MKKPKDAKNRIVVTLTTDPRQKIFSTRRMITHMEEVYQNKGMLVADPEDLMSEGLPLAEKLFSINGVQFVSICQYDVRVSIGRAFDWKMDYLENAVIAAIKNYFATVDTIEDIAEKKFRKKKK